MKKDIKNNRKKIIYRCSYTGTKETDLLYKKFFLERLDNFNYSDTTITRTVIVSYILTLCH